MLFGIDEVPLALLKIQKGKQHFFFMQFSMFINGGFEPNQLKFESMFELELKPQYGLSLRTI